MLGGRKIFFVIFIGFSQAYDVVARATLLRVLQRLRYRAVMLVAVEAMYRVMGTAVFAATPRFPDIMFVLHSVRQ